MPPARDVDVKVKPRVAVGASSIATGAVTVAGYAGAIAAFAAGARDEVTLTTLILGTVGLVTFAASRVAQAVAAIKAARPAPIDFEPLKALDPVEGYLSGSSIQNVARLEERVVAAVGRGFREQAAGEALRKRVADDLGEQREKGIRSPGPAPADDRAEDADTAEEVDKVLLKDDPADDPDPGEDLELVDSGDVDDAGDSEPTVDGRPAYMAGVEDVPAHADLKD